MTDLFSQLFMAKSATSTELPRGVNGAPGKAGEHSDMFSKIFSEQSVNELSGAQGVASIAPWQGELSTEQRTPAASGDLDLSALSPEEVQALLDGAALPPDGKGLPLPMQAVDQVDLATASVVLPVQAAVDAVTRGEQATNPTTPTTVLNAATSGAQGSAPALAAQSTTQPAVTDEGMPRWFSLLRGDSAVAPGVTGNGAENLELRAQTNVAAAIDTPRPAPPGGAAATQPLGVPLEQPARAPLQLKLSTPVSQPGWDRGVGQQVLWMVNNKQQTAQIRLNPPELGPIEVKVSVQNDTAQVQFTAQQPAARDALEAALPRLREMLAEQGLDLGDADVSAGQSESRDGEGGSGDGTHRGMADTEADGTSGAGSTVLAAEGLVDTFV